MGFSNQGKQGIATQFRSSGRGFAAVDPERQREIDIEHARMIARREDTTHGAMPCGWRSLQRDPADEGGSVRRGR